LWQFSGPGEERIWRREDLERTWRRPAHSSLNKFSVTYRKAFNEVQVKSSLSNSCEYSSQVNQLIFLEDQETTILIY
jgi:hypothetical protein